MKRKKLRKIIQRRICKCYSKAGREGDRYAARDMHRFRLSYKKLDTLISLFNAHESRKKSVAMPAELKAFFQYCGDVRNCLLRQQELVKYCGELLIAVPQALEDWISLELEKAFKPLNLPILIYAGIRLPDPSSFPKLMNHSTLKNFSDKPLAAFSRPWCLA